MYFFDLQHFFIAIVVNVCNSLAVTSLPAIVKGIAKVKRSVFVAEGNVRSPSSVEVCSQHMIVLVVIHHYIVNYLFVNDAVFCNTYHQFKIATYCT